MGWLDDLSRPEIAADMCGRSHKGLFSVGSLRRLHQGVRTLGLFVIAAVLWGCPDDGTAKVDLFASGERGVSIAVLDTGQLLVTASGAYESGSDLVFEMRVLAFGSATNQEWTANVRGGTGPGAIVTHSRIFLPTVDNADDVDPAVPQTRLFISSFDLEGRLDWQNRYGQSKLSPDSYALMNDTLYIAGRETAYFSGDDGISVTRRPFVMAVNQQDGTELWIRALDFEDDTTKVERLMGYAAENILYGLASIGRSTFETSGTEFFLFSVDGAGTLLSQVSLGILGGRQMTVPSFEILDSLTAQLMIVYEHTVDGKREDRFILMRLDFDGDILFSHDGLLTEPRNRPNFITGLRSQAAVVDSDGNTTMVGERIDEFKPPVLWMPGSPADRGFIVQIDREGEVRWFIETKHPLHALTGTSEGDFLATGTSHDFMNTVLIQVDADGREMPFEL